MGSTGDFSKTYDSGGYTVQQAAGDIFIRDSYGKIVGKVETAREAEALIRRLDNKEYQAEQERRTEQIKKQKRRARSDEIARRSLEEARRRLNNL